MSLELAYKYVRFHSVRNVLIMLALSVVFYLPVGLDLLINNTEKELMSRAEQTDLVIGMESNPTDLTLSTLYFTGQEGIQTFGIGEKKTIDSLGFGISIPVLTNLLASGIPLVGTDLDYFKYRSLKVVEGRFFQKIGQCVIGYEAAELLYKKVGSSVITSSDNFLNLSGVYPLELQIVGILEECNCPDDDVIFTDLKSNWIAMGIGHGHEEDAKDESGLTFSKTDSMVRYTEKVKMYQEINEKNIETFHFHGDQSHNPISAIIFWPDDEKSLAIFRGKIESGEVALKGFVPKEVISQVMNGIFRFESIFNSISLVSLISTLVIFAMIVFLSIRIRKEQIETMLIMGSSSAKVRLILCYEIALIFVGSILFASIYYIVTYSFTDEFIKYIIS